MADLWKGRFSGELAKPARDFNQSLHVDGRMIVEDIKGSLAHVAMLGRQGIITEQSAQRIEAGLLSILNDYTAGCLEPDQAAEDVHTLVEGELTRRIGDDGKRLHTARSRNDQVALDFRLYAEGEAKTIHKLLTQFIEKLTDLAETYAETIMPGYTHLQRAQPITFGHHLLAYAAMFLRDCGRIRDAVSRMMAESPLGACALAGTTYPTDRREPAQTLGFTGVAANSLDAVADRDFAVELTAALSIIMMHLSRLAEEVILWCSQEFRFLELDDAYATGSSIMPQKKNPDIAELVRGKTGRVYGDLITLLTMLKGLPLAYNKDMQEDKEAFFDACDTVKICLELFPPMLVTAQINSQEMRKAAADGLLNATDCADYLVRKGVPFREAYQATGALVARCLTDHTTLEHLPLTVYQSVHSAFAQDIYQVVDLDRCVTERNSEGGTAPQSVRKQIAAIRERLANEPYGERTHKSSTYDSAETIGL